MPVEAPAMLRAREQKAKRALACAATRHGNVMGRRRTGG
jgi:hypothetical protein